MTRAIPHAGFASRAGAVVILVALSMTLWWALIVPAGNILLASDSEVREKRIELGNLRDAAEALPRLKTQLSSATAKLASTGVLWPPASALQTTAALQSNLRAVLVECGGSLQLSSSLPSSENHGMLHVSVRAGAVGSLDFIDRALRSMAKLRPAMIVDELKLQVQGPTGMDREPVVEVDLIVSGYGKEQS